MRPSTNAVVAGLPRSWQSAPSMSATAGPRSRPSVARSGGVHDHQRVRPHVAFRMPLGVLRTADERREFRQHGVESTPSSSASARPIDGRSAWSSSFSNSPQTRSGGRSSSGDRSQERLRLVVDRELEARRELQRAQHAKAVVAKRSRIDHAEAPGLEIAPAVERIEDLARQRVARDRVDREIAPSRRVRDRKCRIARAPRSPCGRGAIFDSRRGSETSMSPSL